MKKRLGIGIVGLGTVGLGLIQLLEEQKNLLAARAGMEFSLVSLCAQDKSKKRAIDIGAYPWVDDPLAMVADPNVDVVVEVMGGADGLPLQLARTSLQNKKAFVTANKAMLAKHGAELSLLAEEQQTPLCFEAAVGGAMPILKTIRESLAGNHITEMHGILNGTCNFILTEMQVRQMSFADALREAQQCGYAEADPALDIEGHDAAQKISLLAALAFGIHPTLQDMNIMGIQAITQEHFKELADKGYAMKLIASAKMDGMGLYQSVQPMAVPFAHPLANVTGVMNGIYLETTHAGPILLTGRGGGGPATGSALAADLVDVARGYKGHAFGVSTKLLKKTAILIGKSGAFCAGFPVLQAS
jgi:homoserine dehydrogenase